jgi:PHD/YefM family antitoxin component YafN of YafNO toxin-antitoxin module
MIKTQNIQSLTAFQKNAKIVIQKLTKSKEPLVLTVNGKALLVIQDASAYQSLLQQVERVKLISAINDGMEDVRAGRTRSAEVVFSEMEAEYGF